MNISNLLIRNLRNKHIYAVITASLVLFLSACLKDDNSDNGSIPATLVSVVHASPDGGDLIVGIDGSRANNQSFNFGNRIVYLPFFPGGHQFQVNRAADNKMLDVKNWNLEGGVYYTIFAVDRLDSLELLGVRDFYAGDKFKDGHAKVRFINLCPDSLSLDLKANAIDTLLASNRKFKQNSQFGDIMADDKTSYNVQILDHATGRQLAVEEFKPAAERYYTIMAGGVMDPKTEAQKLRVFVLKHD